MIYADAINADPSNVELQARYVIHLTRWHDPRAEGWLLLLEQGHKPTREHDGTWTWTYPFAPIDGTGRPRSFWRWKTFFHAMDAAAIGLAKAA